jgi:hypothetical protein
MEITTRDCCGTSLDDGHDCIKCADCSEVFANLYLFDEHVCNGGQELNDGPPACDTCEDTGAVACPQGYNDIVSCPDCGPGTCPVCGGPGVALGTLGNLNHFRCSNCGTDYNQSVS